MNKKIRQITESAVLLALLVCLQALTKPMGQLVTGSCVNAILAIAALLGGLGCGLTVALISPVCAFLLGKKIGETVVLAPPMLKMLPAMFTWPQLFTALIGGVAALLMVPVLRKALHR